jgi:hypothetical protein
MNDDRSRQKITIEDLLRVKRAERPPAEFWVHFERELRAKQLAAIVAKRSWWQVLPRAVSRVTRLHLPLGATAVLAVTVLSIREYRVPSVDHDLANANSIPVATLNTRPETAAPVASSPAPAMTTPVTAIQPAVADATLSAEPAVSTASPGEISRMINGLASSAQTDDALSTSSPSSRFLIAAALKEQAGDTEPEFLPAMSSSHGFETRGVPARMTDPLAQAPSPKAASLRARYLTTALSTSYTLEPASTASHNLERIRPSQLRPDEVSRFEISGDRASIKLW